MARPALSDDTVLNLYVPSGTRPLGIADGSAIVGLPVGDGTNRRIEAHYEGAVRGQNMDFEEKIQHAAGRMRQRYPTSSFGLYEETDLLLVGSVARSERLRGWTVTDIVDQAALELWTGETVTIGGSQNIRSRAAGIAWGRLSSAQRMQMRMRSAAGADITELVLAAI